MRDTELVGRLKSAIERRDADAVAALYAEDAVGHHPLAPEPLRGREAIRASEAELFAAFSDTRVAVRGVYVDGHTVVMEVVLFARNTGPLDVGADEPLPPTGRSIEVPAVWICALGEDGLIRESRDYFDTAIFMAQLGLGAEAEATSA